MNKRIFALLLCAVMTLVGCSKVDDGLETVDAAERSTTLVESTETDRALSVLNDATTNMNRVGCNLNYFSGNLDCNKDERFYLIEKPGSNCLNFGFEFVKNSSFVKTVFGDTNDPQRINWIVIGEGVSTYCGYYFNQQFSINETYTIGLAVEYKVGTITFTKTLAFQIDIGNDVCDSNTVIINYDFIDTGHASLTDDDCGGGGGLNVILP